MDDRRAPLTLRQLCCLGFVTLLSPALRLLPGYCAELAGPALWLCPLAALPALLLLALCLRLLLQKRRPGEGPGAMVQRALGRTAGGAALGLFALWLTFYTGFVLRAAADRFMSTVYPESGPALFILVLLAMSLTAALGRTRALARAAELFFPPLLLVLLLVIGFSLPGGDLTNLLPVTARDALPVLRGALPVAEITGFSLLLAAGLTGAAPQAELEGRRRTVLLWCCGTCALLAPVAACCTARFGAELTLRMPHPFFVLTRNTALFGSVERVEALVTALWVLPDFALAALGLTLAGSSLRLAFGYPRPAEPPRPLSLRNGRWLLWLCAAGALAAAFWMAPTAFQLHRLSRELVMTVNLALLYAALPLILAIGKLRKKI